MLRFLVNGLQCYQCDSRDDEFCPAFGRFDETKNALVDCYGLESATPGHMCVKISKSSPDTLYGQLVVSSRFTLTFQLFNREPVSFSQGMEDDDSTLCLEIRFQRELGLPLLHRRGRPLRGNMLLLGP